MKKQRTRSYEKPELVELGNVEEITRGNDPLKSGDLIGSGGEASP